MSTLGTFDAFTSARLGIYAAQQGFSVTGNNISNINTEGYTRQRLDQVSFKAGAYDRYRSQLENHVGSGALVVSINQIRDPYLDVRYRNTNADVGYYDTMLAGLQDVATILDEVGLGDDTNVNKKGDGRLMAQFQAVADALRKFSEYPTKDNDTIVRNEAATLCQLFNTYATKLQTLYKETQKDYDDTITEINECLTNIRDLNDEIRDNEIFGDPALELRDERNRQIDKLSELIHIQVVYSEEDVGNGRKVEKCSIYLDNDNPDPAVTSDESMLVDGIFAVQLSRTQVPTPNPDWDGADADTQYLDADGKPCAEADAALMDSPNYDISLSKLLDEKGREWKNVISNYTPLTDQQLQDDFGMVPGVKAVYECQITGSSGWTDGDTIEVGANGSKLVVGKDITAADMADPAKVAAALAGKLTADGYKVTANGDKLVFTATKTGAVGSKGPEAAPTQPTLTGASAGKSITFGAVTETTEGVDYVPPTMPADTYLPTGATADTATELTGYRYSETEKTWYKVSSVIQRTEEVELKDNDLHGSLQAIRELLTEAGEFATKDTVANVDNDAQKKRGIPYYQLSLDLLAKRFAEEYNKLNVGFKTNEKGNYIDKDGNEILMDDKDEDGNIVKVPASGSGLSDWQIENLVANGYFTTDNDGNKMVDINRWLKENNAESAGGPLFSNRGDLDDTTGIVASNISVAHSWSNGDIQLVPKYEVLWGGDIEHSTQNTNADHMVSLIEDEKILYDPRDLVPDAWSSKLFEGTFNGFFNNMGTVLGGDMRKDNVALNTHYTQLIEIDTSRDGVSGVDLNDEAMNLMQYQKAYSAACRLMTVVDEALDRLINNTGIAGR